MLHFNPYEPIISHTVQRMRGLFLFHYLMFVIRVKTTYINKKSEYHVHLKQPKELSKKASYFLTIFNEVKLKKRLNEL